MISGWAPSVTQGAVMVTLAMVGSEGTSYMILFMTLLQNGPQASGADAPVHRPAGHRLQGVLGKLQVHVVILQQLLVLLHQGVLGLGEDLHHLLPVQGLEGGDDGQAAHQLGG